MREMRNAYHILVGKPKEKRSLGIPRRRWEGNIRMDIGYRNRVGGCVLDACSG
jgi:hypothetical protein